MTTCLCFVSRVAAGVTAIASSGAASYPCPQQNRRTPRQGVLRRGVGNLQPPARASVQAAGIDTRRAETQGSVACIAQYSDESPTGKAGSSTSAKEICREIPSMIFKVMKIPSNIFKPRHTHDDHRKPPHFVCPSGRTASASSRPPASDLRASRSCSFLT